MYRSWPTRVLGPQLFEHTKGSKHGCVAACFIERDFEERTAQGAKLLRYLCRLDLWFQSRTDDAEEAMDAYDVMIESLKTRLRGDHQLGRPDIILQAGEGSDQIEGEHGEPQVVEQTIQIWGAVRFQVQQWLSNV